MSCSCFVAAKITIEKFLTNGLRACKQSTIKTLIREKVSAEIVVRRKKKEE